MDRRATDAPPFREGDPLEAASAYSHWLELARQVSAGVSRQEPELWLGELVVEVQKASDRALLAARGHADCLIADARAEANSVRAAGRRRAHAISELRAALHLQGGAQPPGSPGGVRFKTPVPPKPHSRALTRRSVGSTAATGHPPSEPYRQRSTPGETPNTVATPPMSRCGPAPARARQASPSGATPGAAPQARDTAATARLRDGPAARTSQGRADTNPRDNAPAVRLRIRPRAAIATLVVVLVALGLPIFEHSGTAAREHRAQRRLAAQFAALPASPAVPATPAKTRPGSAFASLDIPRLHESNLAVVEGLSWSNLTEGPAHDASSQIPGQRGAVVVAGHLGTYGAPFAHLATMRVGDVVSLRTRSGLYVYRVSRRPQVLHPGSGTLQLPSATEVRAAGGSTAYVDQVLVLATGTTTTGRSEALEVVVATLNQVAGSSRVVNGPSGEVVAQLQFVPGQGTGILLWIVWLVVLVAVVRTGFRLRTRIPPALAFALTAVGVAFSAYQMYSGIDRLVPGIH